MAGYNGAGVFSFSYPDFVSGTVINSSQMDQNFADGKSGFDLALTRDGQGVPTANLPMATFKHTGVNPTSGTGATTEYLASGAAVAQSNAYATTTGSANAYVLTLTPAVAAYAAGQRFQFKANFSNTAAATIAVSGLTATAIQKSGAALVADDIVSGNVVEITHDGTQFQLLSRRNVAAANTWTGIQTFSSGIIFANETLSTYDEGTWTAAWSLASGSITSYTNQTMSYTRIGRLCAVHGGLYVNAVSSPAGSNTRITGLPFTVGQAGGGVYMNPPLEVLPRGWNAVLVAPPKLAALSGTTTASLYLMAATGGMTETNSGAVLNQTGNNCFIGGTFAI